MPRPTATSCSTRRSRVGRRSPVNGCRCRVRWNATATPSRPRCSGRAWFPRTGRRTTNCGDCAGPMSFTHWVLPPWCFSSGAEWAAETGPAFSRRSFIFASSEPTATGGSSSLPHPRHFGFFCPSASSCCDRGRLRRSAGELQRSSASCSAWPCFTNHSHSPRLPWPGWLGGPCTRANTVSARG